MLKSYFLNGKKNYLTELLLSRYRTSNSMIDYPRLPSSESTGWLLEDWQQRQAFQLRFVTAQLPDSQSGNEFQAAHRVPNLRSEGHQEG